MLFYDLLVLVNQYGGSPLEKIIPLILSIPYFTGFLFWVLLLLFGFVCLGLVLVWFLCLGLAAHDLSPFQFSMSSDVILAHVLSRQPC